MRDLIASISLEGLGHACIATELHEPLIQASIEWLWEQTCRTMSLPMLRECTAR